MGLLDDAIREHLDLKRQHGAAEDELARQEAEALGPVTEADIADGQEAPVDEPEGPDGEQPAGWPFDRVAENELAGEPEEPSFEWGEGDSGEVEVPSFVPAEPVSDPGPDPEPELVDDSTMAFDALEPPVGEQDDEFAAPEASIPVEEDPLAEDLETGPPPAGPDTEFMPPPALEIDEREPLEPGPAAPEPPALEAPPTDLDVELAEPEPEPLEPLEPDGPVGAEPSRAEPPPVDTEGLVPEPEPEPEPLEPDDSVEVETTRAEAVPIETEPPLHEPEALEPYPLESVEAGLEPVDAVSGAEPEPSADPGEAPELDPSLDLPPEEEPPPPEPGVFAPEPPLLEEREEPPLEESPPPIGPRSPVGLDPTAEQGDPPGTVGDPIDAGADPPTQAWSIEDEVEEDLVPAETAPIDERPVFAPLPDAEEGYDDALEPPGEHPLDLDDPADADLAPEEDPPPREQPPAAKGFFEETEEHETLWHEERPGADPDFEN